MRAGFAVNLEKGAASLARLSSETRRGSCCPPLTPESSGFPPRQPKNAGIHLIADEAALTNIQVS